MIARLIVGSGGALALVLLPAGSSGAQDSNATQTRASGQTSAAPAAPAARVGQLGPARVTMLRNRYHVRQVEAVLARAVEHAAEIMAHRLTSVSPDVMALAGSPRAQGFHIDGYGLFFAVEVPRLSDSMTWALQVLSNGRDERTLTSLQRLAQMQTDPVLRADLEAAMRSIERQMLPRSATPTPTAGANTSAATRTGLGSVAAATSDPASTSPPTTTTAVAASATSAPGAAAVSPDVDTESDALLLSNPSAVYEEEVKSALVDALLDYSLSLPLAPGECVTVAARDAGYIAFPDALAEMVTVTLSVYVDDLLEFRAQRIDREEARRRVLVREF